MKKKRNLGDSNYQNKMKSLTDISSRDSKNYYKELQNSKALLNIKPGKMNIDILKMPHQMVVFISRTQN
jgi:hypothetical protein